MATKEKSTSNFRYLDKDTKLCLKINKNGEVAVAWPEDAEEGTTQWTPDMALAKALSLGLPLHKYSFYVQEGLTFADVGKDGVEVTAKLYYGKPQVAIHKPVRKVIPMTKWIN